MFTFQIHKHCFIGILPHSLCTNSATIAGYDRVCVPKIFVIWNVSERASQLLLFQPKLTLVVWYVPGRPLISLETRVFQRICGKWNLKISLFWSKILKSMDNFLILMFQWILWSRKSKIVAQINQKYMNCFYITNTLYIICFF